MNKRGLSIWFHSFILSLFQPPSSLNLFCYPLSLSLSLCLSNTFHSPRSILFSLTWFQLVLLSISYHLPLIPPPLPSSFHFLHRFLIFHIWFSVCWHNSLSLIIPLSFLSVSLSPLCLSFLSASVHPRVLIHYVNIISPSPNHPFLNSFFFKFSARWVWFSETKANLKWISGKTWENFYFFLVYYCYQAAQCLNVSHSKRILGFFSACISLYTQRYGCSSLFRVWKHHLHTLQYVSAVIACICRTDWWPVPCHFANAHLHWFLPCLSLHSACR